MTIAGTVLVTGGTGSFGRTIVKHLLREPNVERIRILSRDESKQDVMREEFDEPRLVFITGDVRDKDTVLTSMREANWVFHAAALKQVPNCERFPMEAIRTNALGSENVRQAALEYTPEAVVALSTDKACAPINAMGLSKALMEKLLLRGVPARTRFICARYGNVLGSRGSVVPLFLERIRRDRPLPITDPGMTRFLLDLNQAVATAIEAAHSGKHGELWVRKMPAATIADIAAAVSPRVDYPTEIVGVRPGEKMHEVLVNEDEMRRATEHATHYVVGPEPRALSERRSGEYTSFNTDRLDANGVREALKSAGLLL